MSPNPTLLSKITAIFKTPKDKPIWQEFTPKDLYELKAIIGDKEYQAYKQGEDAGFLDAVNLLKSESARAQDRAWQADVEKLGSKPASVFRWAQWLEKTRGTENHLHKAGDDHDNL